ncbi:hypothetical protein C8F01DRAFT_1161961 [Mycena amicta]|nr:hypothetical protein C8F01DRAFT_1161961 [Mycena amicta]
MYCLLGSNDGCDWSHWIPLSICQREASTPCYRRQKLGCLWRCSAKYREVLRGRPTLARYSVSRGLVGTRLALPRHPYRPMSSSNGSTPQTVSLSDGQQLYRYGLDITQDAVGIIFETCCLSVYTVFFFLALYSIYRKGIKSWSSVTMFFVVLYLYLTSLTLWGLSITRWFLVTSALLLPADETMPLVDRLDVANAHIEVLGTPMEALFMFNMIVGDSVVIWRAWVLYRRSLWVVAIPCALLLVSLIFTIIDLTCLTGSAFSDDSSVAGGGAVCAHAELISWAFSLFTNASCTLLIGIKAWSHRRMMRSLDLRTTSGSGLGSPRFSVDKVLSLLVESGCIYCLFWLTQVVLFVPISRFTASIYAYEILGAMGDQISGLYPTLIIVIVNFHHTIWENRHDSETLATPVFAANLNPGRTAASASGKASTIRWARSRTQTDTTLSGGLALESMELKPPAEAI